LGRRPSKTQKWIELWRNAGDVLGLWFFKSFVFFGWFWGLWLRVSSCIGGI
jgi:hypothetical protein